LKRAIAKAPGWAAIKEYLDAGRTVIGIDEVGRGAWAGPVVAGAVILKAGTRIAGVNDSKLVTALARSRLETIIHRRAVATSLGWVTSAEIDANGLSWAIAESGRRALAGIDTANAVIILDGKWNYLRNTHDSVAIVKADSRVLPVAAASILAKVARDTAMQKLDLDWPDYGFATHVGYGTAMHQQALLTLGITQHHRRSVKPVAAGLAKLDADFGS
jgi:ribonuclease HII